MDPVPEWVVQMFADSGEDAWTYVLLALCSLEV